MNRLLQERIRNRQESLKKTCEALLANHSNIVLEIGCGHGHFLNAYAEAFPSTFCVGIDFNQDRITSAKKKQTKTGLSNLVFLKAEANEFLNTLPPYVQLDAIFLLFLDPWPKTRHHKKRLIQAAFLDLLAKKSYSSTRLYFKTDHRDYFQWASRAINQHPCWQINTEATWPLDTQTHFEKMFQQNQSLIANYTSLKPFEQSSAKVELRSGLL